MIAPPAAVERLPLPLLLRVLCCAVRAANRFYLYCEIYGCTAWGEEQHLIFAENLCRVAFLAARCHFFSNAQRRRLAFWPAPAPARFLAMPATPSLYTTDREKLRTVVCVCLKRHTHEQNFALL